MRICSKGIHGSVVERMSLEDYALRYMKPVKLVSEERCYVVFPMTAENQMSRYMQG